MSRVSSAFVAILRGHERTLSLPWAALLATHNAVVVTRSALSAGLAYCAQGGESVPDLETTIHTVNCQRSLHC